MLWFHRMYSQSSISIISSKSVDDWGQNILAIEASKKINNFNESKYCFYSLVGTVLAMEKVTVESIINNDWGAVLSTYQDFLSLYLLPSLWLLAYLSHHPISSCCWLAFFFDFVWHLVHVPLISEAWLFWSLFLSSTSFIAISSLLGISWHWYTNLLLSSIDIRMISLS